MMAQSPRRTPVQMRPPDLGTLATTRVSGMESAVDASIVAFASVRNNAATSSPSFGDWPELEVQDKQKLTYADDIVPAMIEVSKGSPNKYEVDKETGQLMLDRVLHSSVYYPGDYGYVPQTLCGDGDPLDILLIHTLDSGSIEALDPGVMVNCRVVGLMDMEDESGHDEKLIAVMSNQSAMASITELSHVPEHLQKEIQHFFENYKVLEMKKGKPKWAKVIGWAGKARALEVVKESRKTYDDKYGCGSKGKLHPFVRVAQCPNMLHVQQPCMQEPSAILDVICYINVSKGSLNSYAYRQDTTYRHYKYSLDMPYPGDYGWICRTWQPETKKPIEILVLSTFGLSPECLVDVRIVGGLERTMLNQTKVPTKDIKIIGVPSHDPRLDSVQDLSDLNAKTVAHFCQFFLHSAEVSQCTESKIVRKLSAVEASTVVVNAHTDYDRSFRDQRIHNSPNLWCLPWSTDANHGEIKDRIYPAIVEASKHTSNKYSFDTEAGVLKCDGPLNIASFWPGNAGFLPQTVAEDGRPVDVLILSTLPLQSRSVVEIRIAGAAECMDEMGPDLKVIGIPKTEPRMKEWVSMESVPSHMKDEIVHFLNGYKDLGPSWKFCRFERWLDAEEAAKYVQGAHSRFFLFVLPMTRLEKRVADLEAENLRLSKASKM